MPAACAVYSLVKFGGVRSYVVVTWTPEDLAACADLNLPCADVAALLPRPLTSAAAGKRATDGETSGLGGRAVPSIVLIKLRAQALWVARGCRWVTGAFTPPVRPAAGDYLTPEWLAIVWLKPRLLLRVLQLGYAVLFTGQCGPRKGCQGCICTRRRLQGLPCIPQTLWQQQAQGAMQVWDRGHLKLLLPAVLCAGPADADVAWGRKAVSAEESLLALVEQSQADGAFIAENPGERALRWRCVNKVTGRGSEITAGSISVCCTLACPCNPCLCEVLSSPPLPAFSRLLSLQ